MKKILLAAVAATAFVSTAAWSAANIDIVGASVSGWVGKGDVQTAFGYNNKAMQNAHQNITFDLDMEVDGGSYVCEWTTEPEHNRRTHDVTRRITGGLSATLADADRRTGQYTGWHIVGGSITETSGEGGAMKAVGDDCLGNGTDGTVVEVTEGTGVGSGGLYAKHGTRRELIQSAVITIN